MFHLLIHYLFLLKSNWFVFNNIFPFHPFLKATENNFGIFRLVLKNNKL
jgi:hypothetical protein